MEAKACDSQASFDAPVPCHEMQVAMVMGGCKVQLRGDWEKVSREDAGGGYFLVLLYTPQWSEDFTWPPPSVDQGPLGA